VHPGTVVVADVGAVVVVVPVVVGGEVVDEEDADPLGDEHPASATAPQTSTAGRSSGRAGRTLPAAFKR
jgi:hypothetical protein